MTTLEKAATLVISPFLLLAIANADPQAELTLVPGSEPVVSWLHLADKSYTLQTSDDLTTWRSEPGLPLVNGDGTSYSQTVTTAGAKRKFFRMSQRALDQFSISDTPNADGSPQIITTIDGGQLRRYFIFLPPTYSAPDPAVRRCDDGYPLAIICHGSGQTASSFLSQHPALVSKCDAENVILVLPQGTWNAEAGKYSFNSLDATTRRDDLAFVENLVAKLREILWVDRDRIYIGGFSNGGIFSQRAVSRSPGTFAGFTAIGAALGGQQGLGGNAPIIRVPTPLTRDSAPALIVSGRADLTRPFDGGPSDGSGSRQTAAIEMPLFWHEALRCPDPFSTTNILTPGGNLAGIIDSACTGTQKEVTFVALKNMDHIWPDTADNVGWNANAEVIDFFLAHERGAIEDTTSPDPVTEPASWIHTTFQNRDVIHSIPPAPAALIFVAGDVGQIEMIELLEGLAAEGIGFFTVQSEASTWDAAEGTIELNPDLERVRDLHAELVATSAITAETRVVFLGIDTGGPFALHAAGHLDSPTLPAGGIAFLATPVSPELSTALSNTTLPVYFSNGENDTVAPPLPSWLAYRQISVYSTEKKQQVITDYFPALRRKLTADRLTRVPGIDTAKAGDIITELTNNNVIDASGNPLLCPDELDYDNILLPAGLSPEEEIQVRRQLCVAFAGHTPDASSLPSLRRFCIGARRLNDPPLPPIPISAPADTSPVSPVPAVPWTSNNQFDGFPVRAYIPANPVALTYFFHGTSGDISFYERVEQREMIHALYAANIAVVCTISTDRDDLKSPASQWDTRSLHPDTDQLFTENEDWQRLMALRDQLITSTGITATTPLFAMGFSNGGGFSLTFAHLAQQTGLDFRGAALHAQPAFDESMFRACRRLEPGTPVFLTALANDSTASKIPVLADMLTELGHDVSLHIADEVLLKPDRFQRIPGTDATQSQAIFDNLVAAGTVDATGLRQVEIDAPLPVSNADIQRQLRSTIIADHAFSARVITEEIAWFEAQLP